jgi:hypothetical protein
MMLKKTIFVLIAGFLIQFLISCGKCGPSPTLEMIHTELSLTTGAEVDNRFELIEDTVRKENFILEIYLNHEQVMFSENMKSFSFGFNSAQALDCPDPKYSYSDKVEELSIVMINQTDTSQTIDVTSIFGSEFDSETYKLKDLIEMQYEQQSQFSLYLSLLEDDSLYNNTSFQVTITLESGQTFIQETEEIIFID